MRQLWQKAFLAALETTASVTQAAEAAGITRVTAYGHKRRDAEFEKLWDEALDMAADMLEDEVRRRALEGVDVPVFHQGEQCGVIRKYSDTLLMFYLKGIRPQKWRESRASLPPAELNKMIEAELERIALRYGRKREPEALEPIN